MDHVFASGRDVNMLVLDTEVYSNTGGQASKSTPRGAVAKFAAGGKPGRKKDLGMIAMAYGNVFVGQISLGAEPGARHQDHPGGGVVPGTSLLIAFSHCIGWGIDMTAGMTLQKEAVACGYWPLYHFDPRDQAHPFHLDSRKPVGDLQGVRHEGGPLRHAGPLQARRPPPGCWSWRSRTSTPAGTSTINWPASSGPRAARATAAAEDKAQTKEKKA